MTGGGDRLPKINEVPFRKLDPDTGHRKDDVTVRVFEGYREHSGPITAMSISRRIFGAAW